MRGDGKSLSEVLEDTKDPQFRYKKLYHFIRFLRYRQLDDYDNIIAVTGVKGAGKSNSACVGADWHHRYMLNNNFNPRAQIGWSIDEIDNMIDEFPDSSNIVWDEALKGAMGEDWAGTAQRDFKKTLGRCRDGHLNFWMCMPDISWFDSKYRGNLITIWIYMVKRGVGIVFLPDMSPGIGSDRWHMDIFKKIFSKRPINYFTDTQDVVKRLRRHPCFFDVLTIPRYRQYELYREIRDAVRRGESATPTARWKITYLKTMYRLYTEGKISKSDIMSDSQICWDTLKLRLEELPEFDSEVFKEAGRRKAKKKTTQKGLIIDKLPKRIPKGSNIQYAIVNKG